MVSNETYQWGQRTFVLQDGNYNRYFAVDTAASLLEGFIWQAREAYQALGLFGPEHCDSSAREKLEELRGQERSGPAMGGIGG